MKKTAIAILIAVLVVAIGAGLCFAGLSTVNFKVRDLGTAQYVTNTHELGESFTRESGYRFRPAFPLLPVPKISAHRS